MKKGAKKVLKKVAKKVVKKAVKRPSSAMPKIQITATQLTKWPSPVTWSLDVVSPFLPLAWLIWAVKGHDGNRLKIGCKYQTVAEWRRQRDTLRESRYGAGAWLDGPVYPVVADERTRRRWFNAHFESLMSYVEKLEE